MKMLFSTQLLSVFQGDGPEGEAESLQARLPALFRKMKKMCVQLLKKNPVPELTEDLDCFTGTFIQIALPLPICTHSYEFRAFWLLDCV